MSLETSARTPDLGWLTMYPSVTAIVVAQAGDAQLRRTITALAEQTRQPDAVIAIDCAGTDETAAILGTLPGRFPKSQFLRSRGKLAFGAAVALAEQVISQPASDDEWLWLLAEDTAPEPRALELLLGTVEVAPSVAVAGPKLMDWDEPNQIRQFGESMTTLGTTVSLVEDELDQAQHDLVSDVLAVAPAGMLIRHTLWIALGGFDPALPVVDDGLDFCVRARLAGFRVALVPAARIGTAGRGIVGPSRSHRGRARRKLFRLRRAAQLHRRMVYAPATALPLHWLTLVPLAVARSIVRLLGKQPGAIVGEFAAAFQTAFGGARIPAARKRLARAKTVGWTSIGPLRVPLDEVRRSRALKRESAYVRTRGERRELNFFSGGGAWVVIGAIVASVAIFLPLLGTSALTGGGLLPLSDDIGRLWHHLGYGWRDIGLGFVGAADPFSAVLAVLGSLTFWQPSFSLVLLFLSALPIAALGAWFAAARLTERSGLRAFAAVLWAVAPMFLIALAHGRPAAVLVHLLLPWLFFAGYSAARSWSASAATSLLFAAACACAPSLAPALLLVWLGCVVTSRRNLARFIAIPIPAAALFAPLVWQQVTRGNWLAIFADPGAVSVTGGVQPQQMILGLPAGDLAGWGGLHGFLHDLLGISGAGVDAIVPLLLIPLGVLVATALLLRGRALIALGIGVLGFATAIAAAQISVQSAGAEQVTLWPGSGLSLYWLGCVSAAVIGLGAFRRVWVLPATASATLAVLFAVPLALAMPLGHSSVTAGSGDTLPAVATAEASSHPRVGTLQIVPQSDGGISARLIRGSGLTLDTQSTLASTGTKLTAKQRQVTALAANLASESGLDPQKQLRDAGIGFILLAPPATDSEQAKATAHRAQIALDGNPRLDAIGSTPVGLAWSFLAGNAATPPAAQLHPNAGGIIRPIVLLGQGIIIGVALLLSIPTGSLAEREIRPAGRSRRRAKTAENPDQPPPAEGTLAADEREDELIAEESAEWESSSDTERAAESDRVSESERDFAH